MIGLSVLSPLFLDPSKFSTPSESQELPSFHSISPFILTDQDSLTFTSSTLAGKIYVASFFFTSCEGPCPVLNGNLSRLEQKFREDQNVSFVSISIDPETDRPEVLKEYGKKFHADFSRWHFLTGEWKDIEKIALSGFKLGTSNDSKVHSTKFVLVDQRGTVRGYYDGTDEKQVEQLTEHIVKLKELS